VRAVTARKTKWIQLRDGIRAAANSRFIRAIDKQFYECRA
jgi:hypothetical protein